MDDGEKVGRCVNRMMKRYMIGEQVNGQTHVLPTRTNQKTDDGYGRDLCCTPMK